MPSRSAIGISGRPDSRRRLPGRNIERGGSLVCRWNPSGAALEFDTVTAWIDAYIGAWRSNDPVRIGALFADDATYAYSPWDEPLRGRDAIVADWLQEPDDPGSWEAKYRPLLIEGDRAIVTGVTRYADGEVYSNLFVVDFDGSGRCRAFTEWYMLHPDRSTPV